MDLELSEDQELLEQGAREFLEQECSIERVRALQEVATRGHSEDLFKKLAENGWLGMAIDPAHGGGGLTLFELGLFFREAGRVLLPTDFASTIYAALLIEALGTDEQKGALLPAFAGGDRAGSVAFSEPEVSRDSRYLTTSAVNDGNVWLLNGTKSFVANAEIADPLIVIARAIEGGAELGVTAFLVDAGLPGVSIRRHETFAKDPQSIVELKDVRLEAESVLGGPVAVGNAWGGFQHATDRMTVLQCMEMAGGAEKVVEMSVEYVSGRIQFGVPIGSFQAVQHQIADMATAVDGARLASLQALWLLTNDCPAQRELAIAKAWTGQTYRNATVTAHHLYGGMGYVRESDLHLWSQRAMATELSFGHFDDQLEGIADALGI